MATATKHFDLIQVGLETTPGTLVAATRQIPASWTVNEEINTYRSDYPRSVRATRGGAGVIVQQAMSVDVETELTPHDILWPLSTGILGGVTGSGAGDDKMWTFTPQLSTAAPTLDTATVELVMGDGTTNHYARKFGFAMTRELRISWAVNEIATLRWTMFGRASQASTPTGSLAPYSNRQTLVANLLRVYRDTTWAGLGTTQLAAVVRSAELVVTTGLEPDYTLDGRADLDMTGYRVAGPLAATLDLTLEFNSDGAARSFTDYRANVVQFIRLSSLGSSLGSSNYEVRVDGAYRFARPPSMSLDGDTRLVSASLEAVYDPTGNRIIEIVVVNDLTSI